MIATGSPDVDTSDSGPDPVLRVDGFAATTHIVDERIKASEDLLIALVSHDFMLAQARTVAILLSWTGNARTGETTSGLGGAVSLPALGVTLPLQKLYRRIALTERARPAAHPSADP